MPSPPAPFTDPDTSQSDKCAMESGLTRPPGFPENWRFGWLAIQMARVSIAAKDSTVPKVLTRGGRARFFESGEIDGSPPISQGSLVWTCSVGIENGFGQSTYDFLQTRKIGINRMLCDEPGCTVRLKRKANRDICCCGPRRECVERIAGGAVEKFAMAFITRRAWRNSVENLPGDSEWKASVLPR